MRIPTAALLAAVLLLGSAGASAQGEPGKVSVPEDLFAVITLRGKPCGRVTSYERRGEEDYLVTCQSGHRYRVYVNDKRRVVVEDRGGPAR